MQNNPPNHEIKFKRTNKQKKFLKKPNNKTARKEYFKEVAQNLLKQPIIQNDPNLFRIDTETCAKILQLADISKHLDLKVLGVLLPNLIPVVSVSDSELDIIVENFFNFARHNIPTILYQMLIIFKQKVLKNYSPLEMSLLQLILDFFNVHLGLKRLQKLLRSTEGFKIISQPKFWEPIYFSSSPRIPTELKVDTLWFSVRVSPPKTLSEEFVHKYFILAKEYVAASQTRDNPEYVAAVQGTLRSISHSILETDHREFFLKLISGLPERSFFIPPSAHTLKTDFIFGEVRSLMKCANCKTFEKSEKEFQKCARCGFAFYCSRICQKKDWKNHKKVCKERI